MWQLPQNLLGEALLLILGRCIVARRRVGEHVIHLCFRRYGGVSLGRNLFVHQHAGTDLLRHELGHCRQSLFLGPLYLPVIGVPSIVWAAFFAVAGRARPEADYFRFYTERWANRLAPGEIDVEGPPGAGSI